MKNEIITITINNTVVGISLSELRESDRVKVIDSSDAIMFEIKIQESETLSVKQIEYVNLLKHFV